MSKKSRARKKIRQAAASGVPAWMVQGNLSFVSKADVETFKTHRLGTFGAASAVRQIDPISGRVITVVAELEAVASDILRADRSTWKKSRKDRKPKTYTRRVKNTPETRDAFYRSWEWRTLRMEVLKAHGRKCACCGATPSDKDSGGKPVRIQVDHIRPLSKHWHLRLDRTNLQPMCSECNQGKGAWDTTDWRPDDTELVDEPMSPIELQLGERLRVVSDASMTPTHPHPVERLRVVGGAGA